MGTFGGATPSPEATAVKQGLKAVSGALDVLGETELLRAAPRFDRRGVVDRLRGALGDLFVAKDAIEVSDDGTLEAALTASAGRLRETWALLAVVLAASPELHARLAPLAEAGQALQLAGDRLVARVLDRGTRGSRAPVPPVRKEQVASDELPRVQYLARRRVLPVDGFGEGDAPFAAPSPPPAPARPAPTSLAELAARKAAGNAPAVGPSAPPPAPALGSPRVAFAPEEQRRRLARSAFDDVTSLCLLRRPNEGESWLAQSVFERRLLAHLDALLSLGDAGLGETVLALAEAEVPEEARATAAALVLGSVAGSDTAAQVLRLARDSVGDARTGFALGVLLAPSPDLDAALGEAMNEGSPDEAAFAITALARRGAFPVALVPGLLARRDDTIDGALAFALGRAVSRPRAHEWLRELADPYRSDAVFLPALESLARRAHPDAGALLGEMLALGAESPRALLAARLLGPTGKLAHAEALAAFVTRRPDVELIRGLGQLGAPGVVPALLALLESEEEAHRTAAADALDRFAGPVLRVEVEIPFAPHAPPGAPGRKLARPAVDAAAWNAYFRGPAGKAQLAATTRLRWGRAISAPLCVAEIAHPDAPRGDRLASALALAALRGDLVRFEPDDWVARQREAIASWNDLGGA